MTRKEKLQKAWDYIESHLQDSIDIATLAAVAHLSKYHFHRQFCLHFGISPFALIRGLKLKKAAYQLAFRTRLQVTEIAFQAGFENAESFSRAFRQVSGQSPSGFRKDPDWQSIQQHDEVFSKAREAAMPDKTAYQVQLVDFKSIYVAALEHKGPPSQLMQSIRHFIDWRKSQKLPPSKSRTFNLLYEDPATVTGEEYRFDLCCEYSGVLEENEFGIVLKSIPAGPCAMLRHTGSDEQLAAAVRYLYSVWLDESGYELRDFPLFFERISFFPDVPHHLAVTDIYLPIEG
ncbi:AraC family transcriptional regulator [Rheinheimera soli]|uniref:AraC family transcriptional regulator n=1 Tax=Rheinheimera soli TaxID=443616 RepID=A0ABU1VU24_9GAMM|nr:AraC family transcriptional regulator [Rheinheimera soli]MDR7119110.1 AraC family transcriptional regulator [Rheinheimera soli]